MGAQLGDQLHDQLTHRPRGPNFKPLVTATVMHALHPEGALFRIGQDEAQHRRESSAALPLSVQAIIQS